MDQLVRGVLERTLIVTQGGTRDADNGCLVQRVAGPLRIDIATQDGRRSKTKCHLHIVALDRGLEERKKRTTHGSLVLKFGNFWSCFCYLARLVR